MMKNNHYRHKKELVSVLSDYIIQTGLRGRRVQFWDLEGKMTKTLHH